MNLLLFGNENSPVQSTLVEVAGDLDWFGVLAGADRCLLVFSGADEFGIFIVLEAARLAKSRYQNPSTITNLPALSFSPASYLYRLASNQLDD